MVGRGLGLFENKDYCLILDYFDTRQTTKVQSLHNIPILVSIINKNFNCGKISSISHSEIKHKLSCKNIAKADIYNEAKYINNLKFSVKNLSSESEYSFNDHLSWVKIAKNLWILEFVKGKSLEFYFNDPNFKVVSVLIYEKNHKQSFKYFQNYPLADTVKSVYKYFTEDCSKHNVFMMMNCEWKFKPASTAQKCILLFILKQQTDSQKSKRKQKIQFFKYF